MDNLQFLLIVGCILLASSSALEEDVSLCERLRPLKNATEVRSEARAWPKDDRTFIVNALKHFDGMDTTMENLLSICHQSESHKQFEKKLAAELMLGLDDLTRLEKQTFGVGPNEEAMNVTITQFQNQYPIANTSESKESALKALLESFDVLIAHYNRRKLTADNPLLKHLEGLRKSANILLYGINPVQKPSTTVTRSKLKVDLAILADELVIYTELVGFPKAEYANFTESVKDVIHLLTTQTTLTLADKVKVDLIKTELGELKSKLLGVVPARPSYTHIHSKLTDIETEADALLATIKVISPLENLQLAKSLRIKISPMLNKTTALVTKYADVSKLINSLETLLEKVSDVNQVEFYLYDKLSKWNTDFEGKLNPLTGETAAEPEEIKSLKELKTTMKELLESMEKYSQSPTALNHEYKVLLKKLDDLIERSNGTVLPATFDLLDSTKDDIESLARTMHKNTKLVEAMNILLGTEGFKNFHMNTDVLKEILTRFKALATVAKTKGTPFLMQKHM